MTTNTPVDNEPTQQQDDTTLENVDLESPSNNPSFDPQPESNNDLPDDSESTNPASDNNTSAPTDDNNTDSPTYPTSKSSVPTVVVSTTNSEDGSKELPAVPVLDEVGKEIPTDPSTSSLSLPKPRRSKRSPSFALSVSSVSNTGQQTVSSIVFIKNAMESISKHKATSKNLTLSSTVTRALSMFIFPSLSSFLTFS